MAPAAYGNRAFVLNNSGYFFGLHLQAPRPGTDESI
jgi:hypothetical protein